MAPEPPMMMMRLLVVCLGLGLTLVTRASEPVLPLLLPPVPPPVEIPFALPTTNQALFEPMGEPRFFVPTPGRNWVSGTYGCVRSDGHRFHEGLDIKWTRRSRRGEAEDLVWASAPGVVVYINTKPWSSDYGNYVVLRHRLDGMEIYTLYGHLSEVTEGLQVGQRVAARTPLGVMGRTPRKSRIRQDRSHVHFEIALLLTDRYDAWHRRKYKDGVNEHGDWSGLALAGLDPWAIFREQQRLGTHFSLAAFIRGQTELCRVWIGQTDIGWLERYPTLIRRNPLAEREGVAGYEVALDFAGVPFEWTPRSASELQADQPFKLLSVNAAEQDARPCKKLLQWKGGRWQLTRKAEEHLRLLMF